MVDSSKIDVVCLQETKMSTVSRRMVLSMLGSDFDNNFIYLPSDGASGGILVAWRLQLGTIGRKISILVKYATINLQN